MKCAACGYEYRRESKWVDDVRRYRQGKKKGEVKSIDQKEIVFEVGHTDFLHLYYSKEIDRLVFNEGYRTISTEMYACPECGTVRVNT